MQAVALELLDEEAGARMRDMELWEKVRRRPIVTSHGRKVLSWFGLRVGCEVRRRSEGLDKEPGGRGFAAVQHLTLANAMAAFFFRYEGEYRNVEPALWAE